MHQILRELSRRRVFRVAGLYVVVAWLVVQVAETTFPLLSLPDWSVTLALALALVGFPLALVLAWAYDVTPEGIVRPGREERSATDPAAADGTGRDGAGAREGGPSIAVLPFANLSANAENEYFSDGVTEEILDALTKVTTLRVAARTASWAFKGRTPDLAEVAEKLRVDTVLQGSIRRAGNRVRISAQLVDLEGGFQLWSERFDRELADLLAVQEEIARSIVDALPVQLSERESAALRRTPTSDVDAYEYYLLGRWHLHKLNARSLEQAITMFRRAIEADGTFARAWAGLAEALALKYTWFLRRPDLMQDAEHASQQAREHGPELAETRTAHGYVLTLAKRFEEAEAEFTEAIRLDPRYFEAYFFYGRTLVSQGKMREAAEMFGRGHRVRPEDYQTLVLQLLGMRSAGMDGVREVAENAMAVIRKHLDLVPDDPRAYYLGAHALICLDREDEAREWIDRAAALDPEDPGVAYNVACGYARLGEVERALDALERNIARGLSPPGHWVRHDPDFDILRGEPRFIQILERLD